MKVTMMKMKTMTLTILALTTAQLLTTSAHSSPRSTAVEEAHQAYLKKDALTLSVKVKEALTEHRNHPLLVENLMGLVEAGRRDGLLREVPVDWKLPKEVQWLNVNVTRRYYPERGRIAFFLSTAGILEQGKELEQLQVVRYPDQVVIDKAAKIGDTWEGSWTGHPSFWFSGERTRTPVSEGLYLLNVKIKGQAMVQGWFFLSEKNSSASPVVTSPKAEATMNGAQPSFTWKEFRSPEFLAGERRKMTVKVVRHLNENDESDEFSIDLKPETTSYRTGDTGAGEDFEGKTELEPGSYSVLVSYAERQTFGDLVITRTSSTKTPFQLVR